MIDIEKARALVERLRWLYTKHFVRDCVGDAADTIAALAALAEFDASLTDPTNISVHQTAEPAQPVAWYVERRAPGYGDDGVKSGPWWSKNEAKRFADDHHVLRPLYAAPQPPADVPLMTEGDCDSLIAATEGQDFYVRYRLLRLIRAVEAEIRRRCGVVE